jgi:diguanylate cyclase (GGDEF)-like protein
MRSSNRRAAAEDGGDVGAIAGGWPASSRTSDLARAIGHLLEDRSAGTVVDGAGCLLLDGTGALGAVAHTCAGAEALSLAEELCKEGPNHDALGGETVEVAQVHAEQRWRRLGVLIAATPLYSVVSVPVRHRGHVVGTVYAYTAHRRRFDGTIRALLHGVAEDVAGCIADALGDPLPTRPDPLVIGLRTLLEHQPLLRDAAAHLPGAGGGGLDRLRQMGAAAGLSPVEVARHIVETGRVPGAAELAARAAEQRAHGEELARLALTDPLTGLPNRVLFLDRLEQALARSIRGGPAPAVVFVDLDRFKAVNDSLGHEAGDEVLLVVAERLRAATRTEDTACRLGGDEFAVLLETTRSPAEAMLVAERIVEALRTPVEVSVPGPDGRSTYTVALCASLGVATASGEHRPTDLLRDADQAMYVAKSRGGDRTHLFASPQRDAASRHRRLELELRRLVGAIEDGDVAPSTGLDILYQPIVELATGRVVGLEALPRWTHPELGPITGTELRATAEASGLMVPLGAALLARACTELAARPSVPGDGPRRLSVRLTAAELSHPRFPSVIQQALHDSGLEPERLCLVLPSSWLLEGSSRHDETLRLLTAMGSMLSVDGLGTGYDSLVALRRHPVQRVRIDRAFVAALDEPHGLAIAEAVLALARTFGLEAVADGIEEPEQASRLQALGCRLGLGYHYHPPASLDELERVLATGGLAAR